MKRLVAALTTFLVSFTGYASEPADGQPGPGWRTWSPRVFEQARGEGKLVLLDVVADWCTFCKKMDATTYRDAEVLATISRSYIPVRADPERHPQLPARFAEYARPATVILAADGSEVLKKEGYLKPQWMLWTLQAVAQQPTPERD